MEELPGTFTDKQIKKMISEADTKGSGKIDFKDFVFFIQEKLGSADMFDKRLSSRYRNRCAQPLLPPPSTVSITIISIITTTSPSSSLCLPPLTDSVIFANIHHLFPPCLSSVCSL